MAYSLSWKFNKIDNFVGNMKKTNKVFPMATVPVKEGVNLYQHQVKAFNIMLALYGYLEKTDPPTGGVGGCTLYGNGNREELGGFICYWQTVS